MRSKTIFFIFWCLLIATPGAMAQSSKKNTVPLLEKVLTVTFQNETLAKSLKKIGEQGGFTFSYGSGIVDGDRIINAQFTNKTIREILDTFFQGTITYKERKKHIILLRAETSSKESKQISGYVIDEATGTRLRNVSVYDPVSMQSVVTNEYGYFYMEVPKLADQDLKLTINKTLYADTVVTVSNTKNGLLNIPIKIDKEKWSIVADSVGSKMKRFWMATKRATQAAINMENISDTMHREFQFSIVPFVGTNRALSGNVINEYSLNLLGGYSLGVEKFEMGGLLNAVRGDVEGVQISGLVNAVGGKTHGIQLAGLINANANHVRAVQLSGLVNFNYEESESIALAGLLNFTYQNSSGIKVAGLGNVGIGSLDGPAVAGLFNFTAEKSSPLQLAGLINCSISNMQGAQVSGLINYAGGSSKGAQVSGLINLAPGEWRGAQLGILNFANKLSGTQLGFLNFADSMKGTPVGFLSFVSRGGYHKIEVSADEIFYTNVALRTGTHTFYNILTAGARPATFEKDTTTWTFGYGIGTAPKLSRKLFLNIDLTANQVVKGNEIDEINLINKLYVGLEFQVAKKFSLAVGATLNGQVTDASYKNYPDIFSDYKPNIIYDHTYSNNKNLKMWWGGKVGIRFL